MPIEVKTRNLAFVPIGDIGFDSNDDFFLAIKESAGRRILVVLDEPSPESNIEREIPVADIKSAWDKLGVIDDGDDGTVPINKNAGGYSQGDEFRKYSGGGIHFNAPCGFEAEIDVPVFEEFLALLETMPVSEMLR